MIEDAALLHRYLADRSEAAFAALVERHLGFVYQTALRLVGNDAHFAADVTQYVFTQTALKAFSLTSHRVLKGWLYLTTRNAAANLVRAEQRRRKREREAQAMRELNEESSTALDREELGPVIDHALSSLSDRDREAVFLRYFEGCEYLEIGVRLSLTADAARLRIERAVEKMRGTLLRRGVASTAVALATTLTAQAAVPAPAGLGAVVTSGAVANAATGAGLSTILVTFMNTKFGAAAALATLVFFGVGTYEWQKGQRARAESTSMRQRVAASELQLQALLRSAEDADAALAALQKQTARPPAVGRPAAPASRPLVKLGREDMPQAKAVWQQFSAAHPESRPALFEKYKDQLLSINRPLFLVARLSSEQIETLLNRAADELVQGAAILPNSDLPSEGAGLINFTSRGDLVRAAIGDEAWQQLQNAGRMNTGIINTVRRATGFGEEPLSPEQEIQLAQLVANHTPAYATGKAITNLNFTTVDWAGLSTEAQSQLSPGQWKAVQRAFLTVQYNQTRLQAQGVQPISPVATGGK